MRLTTPLRRAGLLAAAAVTAVLALATNAGAQPETPVTDDPRATPFLKNVDINHPEACTVGGLSGETVHPNLFTYTGGDNEQYLNITGVPAGITITGILVKGGDKFNVYLADKLGPTLPWEKLRSPFNNGGQLPQISHWYGCGVKDTTTTTISTTTTTTMTSTTTVTESSTPTSTSSTTSASSSSQQPSVTTTTTSAAVVPVADEDQLASTGFGSAWLLGLGAALVAAGAALVLVMRRRRA